MNGLQLHRALEAVMAMVNAANGYFADNAPWKLAKTDVAAMSHVLHATLDATRRIVLMVQPVMPEASQRLLDLLGVTADARTFRELDVIVSIGLQLPEPQGVFPRWAEPA
jgi:methionyl-tRNA synthetase